MRWNNPLILASSSPRRASLLAEAGIEAVVVPPEIDDGAYTCGSMLVTRWVQSLAILKAQHVRKICQLERGTVLSADTVCVVEGNILGQPHSAEDAMEKIHSMIGKTHQVYTGWCLASIESAVVRSGCEVADISIGTIQEQEITKYVATGHWQGKAGAYNLCERIDAGWPIHCHGDPTSVMGLPLERIKIELKMECM